MKKVASLLSVVICLNVLVGYSQTVDTLTIQSKVFNQTRKIKVLLPAHYGQYTADHPNKDREYVVAYLFDSQNDDYFNFYKATVNYLTKQGFLYLHPIILVGISSANRQYEFLPTAQTEEGLKSFAKSGGADLLATHLRDEVMPLINSKYHVKPYSIGMGHSLGATFVSYSLLKFPELFNAVIAVSPNFHYDKEQLVHKFDSLANTNILNHKFLYMAYGYGDDYEEKFKPGTKKIENLLRKKNIAGLKWQVKALDNDRHGLTAMEGFFKGLVAFDRQFSLSDSQIAAFIKDKNKPFIDNVKEYYTSASVWSGLKLPIVDDINDIGYNIFYGKHIKESMEFFNWGISLYPDDSNLYDSAGEIEQSTGDKTTALKYYKDGLEVVKKQKSTLDPAVYENKMASFERRIASVKK